MSTTIAFIVFAVLLGYGAWRFLRMMYRSGTRTG